MKVEKFAGTVVSAPLEATKIINYSNGHPMGAQWVMAVPLDSVLCACNQVLLYVSDDGGATAAPVNRTYNGMVHGFVDCVEVER